MLALLQLLREKYGGPEGYIKTYTGLTDDDIKMIKNNLVMRPKL